MIRLTENENSVTFGVRVIPRSSKSEIVGEYDECLKIKLTSPPVDGEANAELIKLFSKVFGVSKGEIEIIGGQTSKTKQIRISGLSRESFLKFL